ncbi:MAG: acyl-CoA reductase, partial [Bacteroidota bacterium]
SQINAISKWLDADYLNQWVNGYETASSSKTIAIIMAGNIPLVGFHDFLSVLISGHKALIKMSSDDQHLLPMIVDLWRHSHPEMVGQIEFAKGKLASFDGVIATGSNNSARYFEQYFGSYPHIIRKNRTSVALLTGQESEEEMKQLGDDIFKYFGLGCRNVTKILVPEDYDLDHFFKGVFAHSSIIEHHKYSNNYDYYKALWLMNKEDLLDNGFLLLKEENDALVSPIGTLFYQRYKNREEMDDLLSRRSEEIQCVVSQGNTPFGQAQAPTLSDYADGVDTMKWLSKLS